MSLRVFGRCARSFVPRGDFARAIGRPILERCSPSRLASDHGGFRAALLLRGRSHRCAIVRAIPRDGSLVQSDVRAQTLTIVCEPCGRRGQYNVDVLCPLFGLMLAMANDSFQQLTRSKGRSASKKQFIT
jgi:hypothetical protein